MIIAVSRCAKNSIGDDFILECFNRIATQYPEHSFVFISDKEDWKINIHLKNYSSVAIGPEAKNNLLLKLWYDYKLPAFLKKHKVDILVSMDGIASLRTKVPQCLIVDRQLPYKKNTAAFYDKAKHIAALSLFAKQRMIDTYKIDDPKIDAIGMGINKTFKPLPFEEKGSIKEKYTDGKEYFLYVGPISNDLMQLLKAFSFFKQRQKSNMQLLIVSESHAKKNPFIENIKTYKYRNEVKLIDNPSSEQSAKIMAAAYAFVYPIVPANFSVQPLQAMRTDVPVIATREGLLPEICADAALYAMPADAKDIADKMMLLFKDENLRDQLIIKGEAQAQNYSWEKTATQLWQSIIKTVKQ